MAFGPDEVEGYCETSASASGRRARSAMTMLQPFERRSFAKLRLMPEPAPVMTAVFPSTFMASAVGECGRREENGEERGEEWTNEHLNASDLLNRGHSAEEKPSAAHLDTSRTRQTYY
jgi:hypothetical protein